LLAQGDQVIFSAGYNLANREWGIPNAPDTKFRIGSITKQFTAVAVLLLQERGSLNVADLICQYLEDCPEAWSGIAIEHLLTHTSGVPDFTSFSDYVPTQRQPSTPSRTIARFIDLPLDFPPGETWSYSNSNYILLGQIVEAASDERWMTFLRDNILNPLGLEDTGYDNVSQVVERRAEGYTSADVKASFLDMTIPYSAGGLYSTVEDLYRWNTALYGGEVVSEATLDAMFDTAVPVPNEPSVSYAYGLVLYELDGHPAVGHGGGIDGFTSELAYFPDDDVTAVVLCNFQQVDAFSVLARMVQLYFDAQ
jgi:CubicO group peptidase (beta-lactamase class C family)